MDENIVMYAVQFKKETEFNQRYDIYPTKELRDWDFDHLIDKDNAAKVEMIIRVETEHE